MGINIQFKRGTAAQWTAANPILAAGEVGFETDMYRLKVGDGETEWDDLDYYGAAILLDETAGGTDGETSKAPSSNVLFDALAAQTTALTNHNAAATAVHAAGAYSLVNSAGIPNRNAIINGNFAVAQRGAGPFTDATVPLNSDDTYVIDRWTLLSDGNNIVDVSQETSATITNPPFALKLDVETANKKFGIITILENKDSRRLINQAVSLSFKAKGTKVGGSLTINAVRAAILTWSSTADAVTSDVVSVWDAAGTNPTLAANWNYENVPAALTALSESYQTYKIENITIDTAAATNVAVFIWTDDITLDVGDFLHITEVQLEIGANSTAYEYRPFQQELALCQRYCYGLTTVATAEFIAAGSAFSTTVAYPHLFLPVEMRATPTLIIATAGDWQLDDTVNAPTDVTALVIDDMTFSSKKAVVLKASAASGLTQYRSYYLVGDGNAGRVLALAAEL